MPSARFSSSSGRGRFRRPSAALARALANNVRLRRQELGLSQEKLAVQSGLHRTYVGSVERCERNVTLSTLEAFAAVLGVSVPELLTPRRPDGDAKSTD